MDESRKQILISAGIDADDALERLMGNESLLERFLKKFLEDENYEKLKSAVSAGEQDAALTASHTLKGVCGNLSISGLYGLLTRQVQLMREDNWNEAAAMMPDISKAYEKAADAVRRAF